MPKILHKGYLKIRLYELLVKEVLHSFTEIYTSLTI